MALTTTTITGSLYDATTGAKYTTGCLHIQPQSFIRDGDDLVAAISVTYDIPGSGNISLALAPSNGVSYIVQFDPTPTETDTPMQLKSGYFRDVWVVPVSGPVNITSL
jgi:hypothetical protein